MKLFCMVLLVAAACADDDDDMVDVPDAQFVIDASIGPDANRCAGTCNAVADTGCGVDEKCTYVRREAAACPIACAPAGTVSLGGDCAVSVATGTDDCVGGTVCYPFEAMPQTCLELCVPGSCGAGTCQLETAVLGVAVGVCIP